MTADTITDEQIRELRMVAVQDEDDDLRETCTKALADDMGLSPVFTPDKWRAHVERKRSYRDVCAAVINARLAMQRNVVPHAIDEVGECAGWCRACRAASKARGPSYSPRVAAALAAVDGWTVQDFVDLALAGADQAGASIRDQQRIAEILNAPEGE